MAYDIQYGPGERLWLWTLCAVGLGVVNGAFVWGLLHPGAFREALTNPVALTFVVEALLLMGALAWLLGKWGVSRLSWRWFVALSLLGSMAFALPVVLLWPGRGRAELAPGPPGAPDEA